MTVWLINAEKFRNTSLIGIYSSFEKAKRIAKTFTNEEPSHKGWSWETEECASNNFHERISITECKVW